MQNANVFAAYDEGITDPGLLNDLQEDGCDRKPSDLIPALEAGTADGRLPATSRTGPAPGADLSGQDLKGTDWAGKDLRGADLRDAVLDGANLNGVNLRGADLRGVSATDASLRGADLRGATYAVGDLTGADLTGALVDDRSPTNP